MAASTNMLKRSSSSNQERGFSLIELLIVVAIILVIAAIAIPNLLASKKASNQSSAASSLRTISTASATYSNIWGNGFPATLDVLGGPPSTASSCNAANLVDQTLSLAPFQKSGYQFAYSGQDGNIPVAPPGCSNRGFNGFLITAVPLVFGVSGNQSYCITEEGAIHLDVQGGAIASKAACVGLPALQ